MILYFPPLNWYRFFETFNFLFSSILILLLCSDVLVLSACVDPMYISLHSLHSITYTTFFELLLNFLFILNLVSEFLKVKYLPSIIISHILHRLFLHLATPCVVFFSECRRGSIIFIFLGCLWLLLIFVVSPHFFDLSLFSISSRFFYISVNSSGLFLL